MVQQKDLDKLFPKNEYSEPKPICPFRNDQPCTDKCALYIRSKTIPNTGYCVFTNINT